MDEMEARLAAIENLLAFLLSEHLAPHELADFVENLLPIAGYRSGASAVHPHLERIAEMARGAQRSVGQDPGASEP